MYPELGIRMGQTIAEKIFSNHCGHEVYAGEVVVASVDVIMATDGSGPLALEFFAAMGGKQVFDPTKVIMVLDHYVPCPNDKVSRLQDSMREFARNGQCKLYELGDGICHQLLPEQGHVFPGSLIVGGDSHSTTYGALNALGTGIGSSDLAAAMMTGKLWFRVPQTFKIEMQGCLNEAVTAKDVALRIVGTIGSDGANYKAIEFSGVGVGSLSLSQRMTICNLMVETGAKCAIMPFDEETKKFFGNTLMSNVFSDENANYEKTIQIKLEDVSPMIALPHQVDQVVPITQCEGVPIQMGVLGTCTNGRLDDLNLAASLIGEHSLAPGFELLVVPASREIYIQAAKQGLLEFFATKGASILPPGCGPCCGSSAGIPSDGENVLSTANRNFIGRMGNVKSSIYLGSPASLAAAAVTGKITDPRRMLR